MNLYLAREIIEDYLLWVENTPLESNFACNKVYTVSQLTASERENMREGLFIGCVFIFDGYEDTLELFATYDCLFVCNKTSDCVKRNLLSYVYNFYDGFGTSVSAGYTNQILHLPDGSFTSEHTNMIRYGMNIEDAKQKTKDVKQCKNQSKLQFSYGEKDYSFAKTTFAAGVEIELPISYSYKLKTLVSSKRWSLSIDRSQLEGSLEIASLPSSLGYLKDSRFRKQLKLLYDRMQPPTTIDSYKSLSDSTIKGSGVHIHISWHRDLQIDASQLRTHYYDVLRSLGGRSFCLERGGKQPMNFKRYSPYRPSATGGEKYDCVHLYSENHIELRWLAADPDPNVVYKRVKLAIDIFESAVVQYMKRKINKSCSFYLWKTLTPQYKKL